MAKTTPATLALDKAKVAYVLQTYDYDPRAERVGLQAAEAMGVTPDRAMKTLMVKADGKLACVVVPSDREVSMKKLAAALGAKSAEMMQPAQAERMTGFKVGGISPFGQKRKVPTVVEADALAFEEVYVNGGQRGLSVRLKPIDLVAALEAKAANVS